MNTIEERLEDAKEARIAELEAEIARAGEYQRLCWEAQTEVARLREALELIAEGLPESPGWRIAREALAGGGR